MKNFSKLAVLCAAVVACATTLSAAWGGGGFGRGGYGNGSVYGAGYGSGYGAGYGGYGYNNVGYGYNNYNNQDDFNGYDSECGCGNGSCGGYQSYSSSHDEPYDKQGYSNQSANYQGGYGYSNRGINDQDQEDNHGNDYSNQSVNYRDNQGDYGYSNQTVGNPNQNKNSNTNNTSSDGKQPDWANDNAINDEVRNVLQNTPGGKSIQVSVYEGKVTLRGYVNSDNDKKQIENTVKNIKGVQSVSNKLDLTKNK